LRQGKILYRRSVPTLRIAGARRTLWLHRREKRGHNIEARNDRTLIATILACGVAGAAYGLLVPGTPTAAVGFCLGR
jgi:hypothetical protein